MTQVTFYKNTRYAGGRSHRNIETLEYIGGMDILSAAEHYGYHIFPNDSEDFDNGVTDSNGNEVWDAGDYKKFKETGIGIMDLGETVFYSCELKDIDVDDFKALPTSLRMEFLNISWDVTEAMMMKVIDTYSVADAFEFYYWDDIRKELQQA